MTLTQSSSAGTYGLRYITSGFTMEVTNLPLTAGVTHSLAIMPGTGPITFTSANGDAPDVEIGIETLGADFSFRLFDVEMQADDTIAFTIDPAR